MRTLLIGAIALMVAACASIGRPEGGPRDVTPPEYVRASPEPGAINVDRNRIDIWFNENINLDDPNNKVVVSPVQKENARVSANGRHLTVEFRDTLRDSTTYTIDFADAIRDLNENNPLDGFAYDFSTGPYIDTLTISGMVFKARNLEPAQGMIVGVYANPADSAIKTLPLERVAKTNQLGQFTIRGLRPGDYRVYAIDDRNRDWHWDRSEDVAFFPLTVSPSVTEIEVTDTLRASDGSDSIVPRKAWHYLPDDLLLTWFNENYKSQYLRDNKRTSQRQIELKFGAPVDSMPRLRVLNGAFAGRDLSGLSKLEMRAERDSMVYWLADTMLVNQDSILLETRYRKTDTLDNLVWQTDTLKMFWKRPKVDEKKKKKKEEEAADSLPQITFLNFKAEGSSAQDLNKPVDFTAGEPLAPVSDKVWRLEMAEDTLWRRVADATLLPDSVSPRKLTLRSKWVEGTKYRFIVDSAGISNIYGEFNKPFTHEFTTKKMEDYGVIYMNLTDLGELGLPDSTAVYVELLSKSDEPVAVSRVEKGTATFRYIEPGTYYARAYMDTNGDSLWTTGSVEQKRLPEDVFYYPKKLVLKKNWDLEQDWALLETAVDQQKPQEIKKNKPKDLKNLPPEQDEENMEDEFGNGFDPEQGAWGNGSSYNNAGYNQRGNSRFQTTGRGGMRTARQY